jgi:hypothetical protein
MATVPLLARLRTWFWEDGYLWDWLIAVILIIIDHVVPGEAIVPAQVCCKDRFAMLRSPTWWRAASMPHVCPSGWLAVFPHDTGWTRLPDLGIACPMASSRNTHVAVVSTTGLHAKSFQQGAPQQ